MFSKFLDNVTPEKDRVQSFLKNVTPRSARKSKQNNMMDLSNKVVRMDIDDIHQSMEDVRKTIQERQKKLSEVIEKMPN